MKVLIVEDEAFVAMSLKYLLQVERHDVVGIADDLDGAVAIAEEAQPDVALVDIELARGSSGFDVAAELRKRGIPTIFATGNIPASPRPDLAVGCLAKPYTDRALFSAITTVERLNAGQPPPPGPPAGFHLY